MMKALCISIAVLIPAAGALAQSDDLWLTTAFGSKTLYRVKGGSLVTSWAQTGADESALAVLKPLVKTSGASSGTGVDYTLSGGATGFTHAFSGTGARYDGATDAVNNYSTPYPSGVVTQYDVDWGNESVLFSTGRTLLGIAHDFYTNTMWVVDIGLSPPHIVQYSMGGTLLSEFATSGGNQYSLGWDKTDDTLWTAEYGSSNPRLTQYTKSGMLIQQITVPGLSPANGDILGIEFDPPHIPAPASLAIVGLGGLAAARRRRA